MVSTHPVRDDAYYAAIARDYARKLDDDRARRDREYRRVGTERTPIYDGMVREQATGHPSW